jgi:hypothetical protein
MVSPLQFYLDLIAGSALVVATRTQYVNAIITLPVSRLCPVI